MSLMSVTLTFKTLPLLARVVLVGVVVASTLGMWHAPGMGISGDGDMRGCPLMTGITMLCTMNAVQHLAVWQQTFTAFLPALGSLLLFLSAWAILVTRFQGIRHLTHDPRRVFQRFRRQSHLDYAHLDPLRRALSRGILHPKICG